MESSGVAEHTVCHIFLNFCLSINLLQSIFFLQVHFSTNIFTSFFLTLLRNYTKNAECEEQEHSKYSTDRTISSEEESC